MTSSEDAAKREDARKRALEALSELGIDVKAEDLAKLTPPDEQQEVLELMAEVRAYFDIAYKVRVWPCSTIKYNCRVINLGHV